MPKVILSLDGGGARGLYQLTLLRIIQSRIATKTIPVDLIVGVSAGALVGAILALSSSSLEDGKFESQHLQALMKQIFSQKTKGSLLEKPKYDGALKKKLLHDFFGNVRFGDVHIPLVVVCATMDGGVLNMCSWHKNHANLFLADVLDATSAAPLYFPPVNLNGMWLNDGGIRANKPMIQGLLYAWELFGKTEQLSMLSIGTYFYSKYRFASERAHHMGMLAWFKQGILQVLMGTQDTTLEQFCAEFLGDHFLRLMCMCDDIRLDDHGPEVQGLLKQAAEHSFINNQDKIASILGVDFSLCGKIKNEC